MKTATYIPQLSYDTPVRLTGIKDHPKSGQPGTIMRALPNPSRSAQHQWYDVKFEDGSIGRFLERYLAPANDKTTAA